MRTADEIRMVAETLSIVALTSAAPHSPNRSRQTVATLEANKVGTQFSKFELVSRLTIPRSPRHRDPSNLPSQMNCGVRETRRDIFLPIFSVHILT
jgi:hypothetical protein